MRIEEARGHGFNVVKGEGTHKSGFQCYVGDDGAMWSSKEPWRRFMLQSEADKAVVELKRRERLKAKKTRHKSRYWLGLR
jgi:hypothetical protein